MEMVQWVFEDSDGFHSVLAPFKSQRLGYSPEGRAPRAYERSYTLSSHHLPFPLWYGAPVGTPEEGALGPPSLKLRIVVQGGEGHAIDPVKPGAQPAHVLARMSEFCQCVADVFEEASMPISSLTPAPEEMAFDVLIALSKHMGVQRMAHTLTLIRVALEIIADARGFELSRMLLMTQEGGEREVGGSLARYFLDITQ